MATETWYVAEDGSYCDPAEVTNDGKGLVSADGRRVARHPTVDAYSSRSVDADAERAKAKAKVEKPEKAEKIELGKDDRNDTPKEEPATRQVRGYRDRILKTDR